MPLFPSLSQSVLAFSLALSSALLAQDSPKPDAPATIAQKTAGMKHLDGFLPLDWDAKTGKLYLEIPRLNADGRTPDLLYVNSLPYGTGSNDLSLDRGQLSEGVVVRFERIGPKVLLVETNQRFRSASSDPDEQLAVAQSFPESVLWGFKVEAESADGATVLVDATDFFLHDAHHVSEAITSAQQDAGHSDSYKLDASRSTIVPDDTKAFPKNTVVEAELTFTAEGPLQGRFVSDVAPDSHSLTVRERQMFVELPPLDGSFKPRKFNPRSGYFDLSFRDYTAPLSESLDQHLIVRHRLIKKDPKCVTNCEAVDPIQYYVDRGAPDPIRSALREGASWWDQAFQAAGWAKGTFRVDLLPDGADPMDLRYNIIQWVHRYTRGWSYGDAIADPRTGEILKGNVTLGSLRARQDYLIAEALLSPYAAGKTYTDQNNPMLQMVLARIRQLGAHETGHTLGLSHNFAASSVMQGDSVMDYPHPYIALDADGKIDLSHAYANEIGDWDKVSIDYGYRQFAPGTDEDAALNKILSDADKAGQIYITDEDARPASGAHPKAHLWDNGPDAADELERILKIRAVALEQFGEDAIKPGTPMAQLEETLVPLYLLHRYQTEAAIKLIGGLDYRYNLRGDGQPNPAIVAPDEQEKAIAAVMKTLEPQTLTLPESLLAILPPHPPGDPRTQESFPSQTGLTFDPVAAAEASADLTLEVLLNPARASRLVEYHMREPKSPSLRSLLETISKTTAERPEGGHTMSSEVARAVEFRALEAMLALAVNPAASSQARAIVEWHIEDLLKQWTSTPAPTDAAEAIHRAAMIDRIQDLENHPERFVPAKPIEAPPGMPIGDDEEM
ncbi:MAG: zinc-dependent metalloprotease [Terracidiphilus sp.]